jgi:hypothetical protein
MGLLQMPHLEWVVCFGLFFPVVGVGVQPTKSSSQWEASKLVPVPEDLSQTLLTNEKQGEKE